MKDHLYPFESQIKKYAVKEHDVIDQAILIWRLIYHMIIEYQKKHNDWTFIRHEDLSRDPLKHFEHLFEKLDLTCSDNIKKQIQQYSHHSNPGEAPDGLVHFLKRDSKSNIFNWKRRLSNQEIEKIKYRVADISSAFYSDEDW